MAFRHSTCAHWNEYDVTWNNANWEERPAGHDVDDARLETTMPRASCAGIAARNQLASSSPAMKARANRMRRFYSRERAPIRADRRLYHRRDNLPPVASANPLPQYSPGSFTVTWGSCDQGSGCAPSGIAYYDVSTASAAADGRLANQPAARRPPSTSANGAYVEFRVRAMDIADNAQALAAHRPARGRYATARGQHEPLPEF
jgi:hypothetical protein